MRTKKKGDTTDALDRATEGNTETSDFTAEAKQTVEFVKAMAAFDDDEDTEDQTAIIDEVDEDREAADEAKLEGLDEQPSESEFEITTSDIRKGVMALEKVCTLLRLNLAISAHACNI